MKLAYNIALPVVHLLAVLTLVGLGFARMLSWACWFWVNDLVYILIFGAVITGHWLLLHFGKRYELLAPGVLRGLCTADYILFSLQLALCVAWLVWDLAVPLLNEAKSFSWLVAVALVPVIMVDIAAMVLRLYSARGFLPEGE